MTKFFNCVAMSFCVVAAGSLAACSEEDDSDVTPVEPGSTTEYVFPEGVPAQVGDAKITTNSDGQVTEIVDGDEVVTFKYGSFSRAKEFNAMMLVRDANYPEDDVDFYLQINEQGFITYALEVYADAEDADDEWWFGYNADGQLNYMKRSEGDNEVTLITYVNGDITKVGVTDDENPKASESVIEYTLAADTTSVAIPNKGGIMEFDWTFGIDMDEMGVAYYAGLLGCSTKNLPVKRTDKDADGTTSYETYEWQLNARQLPVKLISTYHYDNWTSKDEKEFKW